MVDLPLPQIHEVGAKHEDRKTKNEQGETQAMQQRV